MKTQRESSERPVDEKALALALNGDKDLKTSMDPEAAVQWLRNVYGISVNSLKVKFGIDGNPDISDADLLKIDGDQDAGMVRIVIPAGDLTGKAVDYPLVKYQRAGEAKYQWSVPSGGSEVLFAGPEEEDLVCLRLDVIQKYQARVMTNMVNEGHSSD